MRKRSFLDVARGRGDEGADSPRATFGCRLAETGDLAEAQRGGGWEPG